jgi:hypothetical protein
MPIPEGVAAGSTPVRRNPLDHIKEKVVRRVGLRVDQLEPGVAKVTRGYTVSVPVASIVTEMERILQSIVADLPPFGYSGHRLHGEGVVAYESLVEAAVDLRLTRGEAVDWIELDVPVEKRDNKIPGPDVRLTVYPIDGGNERKDKCKADNRTATTHHTLDIPLFSSHDKASARIRRNLAAQAVHPEACRIVVQFLENCRTGIRPPASRLKPLEKFPNLARSAPTDHRRINLTADPCEGDGSGRNPGFPTASDKLSMKLVHRRPRLTLKEGGPPAMISFLPLGM